MRGDKDKCKNCRHIRVQHLEKVDFPDLPDNELGCTFPGCPCKEFVLGEIERD